MEDSKVIISADIKVKRSKKWLAIISLWYIICAIVFVILFNYDSEFYPNGAFDLRFYTIWVWVRYHDYFRGGFTDHICWDGVLIVSLIALVVFIVPAIIMICSKLTAAKCSLRLTNKGLTGQVKKIFSTSQLQLPMDKIDNIMVTENFKGGKTVAVRSASGLIKFPWVQNADEFVSTTLAEIEKYNKAANINNMPVAADLSNNASAVDKIKELKELLDEGIISQEEFDAKKKRPS